MISSTLKFRWNLNILLNTVAPFWVICGNVVLKWDIFYDDENVNNWYKNIMMIVGNITSDVYLKYSHTKLYFAVNSVILLLLHL